MARNLAEAGFVVSAWTRSGICREPLIEKVKFHETTNDIVQGCNSFVTMQASLSALDTALQPDALQSGIADGTLLRQHGQRMVALDLFAGGTMSLYLKD